MRRLLGFLKVTLSILIVLNVLIWLMAQGSGHKIPLRTNIKFGIAGIFLIGLLVTTIYLNKKNPE